MVDIDINSGDAMIRSQVRPVVRRDSQAGLIMPVISSRSNPRGFIQISVLKTMLN